MIINKRKPIEMKKNTRNSNTGIFEKVTPEKKTLGRLSLKKKTPNQELDGSFCCCVARQRLAQTDLFVHRHR